uniref:Uncharacterized protein n=1 Tax=Haematobia irritans TaxID=7368 RepID=A0A1L8E7S8_HAEIR
MKWRVSCVTYDPKFLPTIQCHVGLYFLSNSFFMNAAISFSILYFSNACVAQSTASCCISSLMSAFLITALRSDIFVFFCYVYLTILIEKISLFCF